MSTIYFDEAGYTGSDLTNAYQPYFVVGSACFTDEEISQIETDLQLAGKKELHFKELYKKSSGQNKILKVLMHPLVDDKHIKFGVADKRFCIYAQIVDTLVETLAFSIGQNLYANRGNLILANCLYVFAINHPNQTIVKKFERAFVRMIRTQDDDSIEEFYAFTTILQSLPDTNDSFKDALNMVLATKAITKDSFTNDPFYLDNTLSIFTDLINVWYKDTGIIMNVKFDDSDPMKSRIDIITKLKDLKNKTQIVGPKEREHIYPLPVGEFELVDSNDYLGIQIADLIASAFNFIHLNKNPKHEEFRKKLATMPILSTASSTLFPATAEFLEEAMRTPYEGSPIDDIASMLIDNETDPE